MNTENFNMDMSIEQLKQNLNYLVDKYILDSNLKSKLKEEIKRDGLPPVKGIMMDINKYGIPGEQSDAKLFQEIANSYL